MRLKARIPALLVLGILPIRASRAQTNFVYANNDSTPNVVSAFSVAASGVLTPVPGSPFPTGGNGGLGLLAANPITLSMIGTFLYVANAGSRSITGFSINTATGALTSIPGSPFSTGGPPEFAVSLAASPDNRFLFAANSAAQTITAFSIASNGALAPLPGSPFPAGPGGILDGIKVSPDGNYLAVARPAAAPTTGVSMFTIGDNGALTPVPGSPFPGGAVAAADINCAGDLLFGGVATFGAATVDIFNIKSGGTLMLQSVAILPPGTNSNVVLLSPTDKTLFISNQFSNTVTVAAVAGGTLTSIPGSPFATGGSVPASMSMNRAGTLLYVANIADRRISVFNVAGNGALTAASGSPFPVGGPVGQLLTVAAFPPKTCCQAPVIGQAAATPNILSPPNHSLMEVEVAYAATSNCPVTCRLSITSNEPSNGLGDGSTSPDWQVLDAHHVLLRAERSGPGSDRIYVITITCNAESGQTTTTTVTVQVPHDQRSK